MWFAMHSLPTGQFLVNFTGHACNETGRVAYRMEVLRSKPGNDCRSMSMDMQKHALGVPLPE